MPNNKFSQISLFDIYEDVNTSFTEKKSELISLLAKHIDFSSLISYGFHRAFYSTFGRKHKYTPICATAVSFNVVAVFSSVVDDWANAVDVIV